MNQQPGSWPERLFGLAATVLAAVLLLHWAYELIRPFLVWILIGLVTAGIIKLWISYKRSRW